VSVAGRSQQGPPSPKARLTMAGSPKPKVASARRHLLQQRQQRQPPPQRQPPDGPEGEGLGRSSAAAPDVRAEMQALASGFVPPTQVRRVIESPCLGNCTHGDSITILTSGFVPPTQVRQLEGALAQVRGVAPDAARTQHARSVACS
jgi:hypothetical protein